MKMVFKNKKDKSSSAPLQQGVHICKFQVLYYKDFFELLDQLQKVANV